jgi:uncharacterized protein DUF6880
MTHYRPFDNAARHWQTCSMSHPLKPMQAALEAVENMTGDDDPARTIDHIQTIRRAFEADVARIKDDPAAQLIEGKHPLAASLLRRAMIEDTLNGTKSSRYKHAARHLPRMLVARVKHPGL